MKGHAEIKSRRISAGLSIEDLAAILCCSVSSIYSLEDPNKTASFSLLRAADKAIKTEAVLRKQEVERLSRREGVMGHHLITTKEFNEIYRPHLLRGSHDGQDKPSC